MLESSDLVAFVATTDLDRARVFYEQTLGLRVLEHGDLAGDRTRSHNRYSECRKLARHQRS